MPPISCNTTSSGISGSLVSTAYTLSSILWAVLARVKGNVADRFTLFQSPPLSENFSMNRLPIAQIAQRRWERSFYTQKLTKRSAHSMTSNATPQKIFEGTLPIIHHSFPDFVLWSKIEKSLILRPRNITETFLNFSRANLKLTISSTSNKSSKQISNFKTKQFISKSSLRRKRSIGYSQNSDGVFRRRQLYCRTGYHLQILRNGRVSGTKKDHDKFAILDFISVGVGLVTIRGVDSGKYLSMDHKGRLYGSILRTKNSVFKETLQENWFNTYSTTRQRHRLRSRHCFVTMSKSGRWRPGCRSNSNQRLTHFLPRPVDPEKVPELYKGILY